MAQNKFNTATLFAMSYDDFKALPESEQRSATRQLIDIAHKRFQRGVKSWGEMGALRTYAEKTTQRADKTGKTILPMQRGKQSTVSKRGKELYEELKLAQEFLNAKTSTEKGRQEVKAKTEKTLGVKLTKAQYNKVFEMYNKTKELNQAGVLSVESMYGSVNLLREMADYVEEGGSVDEWLEDTEESLNQMYEKAIEEQQAYDEYVALKHKRGRKSNADKLRIQELEKQFGFGNISIVQ